MSLSGVAGWLYWVSRYFKRAEHGARHRHWRDREHRSLLPWMSLDAAAPWPPGIPPINSNEGGRL